MSVLRPNMFVVALVLTSSACGTGSEDADVPATTADGSSAAPTESVEPADISNDTPSDTPNDTPIDTGQDDAPIPVARFVAHGPGEPNTFGPSCSTGIDERGDDMFRVTLPPDWSWTGRSGGSGPDELRFDTSQGTVYVNLFRSADDLNFANGLEVTGVAGTTATLDGEPFAVQVVKIEGRPGFGIVEFPYLGPLPITGEHGGTVLMTSSDAELDAQLAADVLSTVRAERCAVVQEVGIWGPAANVQLVPRFEPDPMGKSYPGGSQPIVAPGEGRINAYTAEQVAYLLPFDEPLASCIAPLIMEAAVDDLVADVTLLSPANDAKQTVATLAKGCA